MAKNEDFLKFIGSFYLVQSAKRFRTLIKSNDVLGTFLLVHLRKILFLCSNVSWFVTWMLFTHHQVMLVQVCSLAILLFPFLAHNVSVHTLLLVSVFGHQFPLLLRFFHICFLIHFEHISKVICGSLFFIPHLRFFFLWKRHACEWLIMWKN